jgi:hypothetical protein
MESAITFFYGIEWELVGGEKWIPSPGTFIGAGRERFIPIEEFVGNTESTLDWV